MSSPVGDNQGPSAAEDRARTEFLEYCKTLQQAQGIGRDYDKWMLTLSGGAFGLSMLFLKDIVPVSRVQFVIFLLLAWLFFAVCLAAILLCMLISQRGSEQLLKIAEREYAREATEDLWDRVNRESARRPESRIVGCVNWLSWGSFLFGIVSLSIFAYLNVTR